MNYLWAFMILTGVVFAAFHGTLPAVTQAALDSAKEAVTLCITMMGVMSFWVGLMKIAEKTGIIAGLSRRLAPVLHFLFPDIPKDHPANKYIATNIKSNIRELEGAFNKVMAGAKLEKKEVTLELAEQALKDIISPDEKKVITPEYIISVVAEHYGVTPADLSGNKRNSKIVMPRQVSMYLCREIISTPLKNIGKALGNRDHTTVMHGIEKIENELQTDDNLKNTIDILKKKINPQG